MSKRILLDLINDLARKIKAAEHHSPANKEIAQSFEKLKTQIELQLSYTQHRFEVVKQYAGGYTDRQNLEAETILEAKETIMALFDEDPNIVGAELYCDGQRVWAP